MADPVDEVGAQLYQLDLITPEQSLTLMSKRIGRALEETEHSEVLKLAEAVGYLSIAWDLLAALLARKPSWSDMIYTLEQEVARLESLSDPHRRKEETRLEACLNLSLNALRDDDIEVWLYFVWLGVLSDDALVAAPMAATLWGVEEAEAADRLELLLQDGLLLPSPPIQVGERTWSAYRLHHLLHNVARRLLTTNQIIGLGIPLATAHADLLKRYRVSMQSDLWHTLADDGYIHAHLTWHLEQAGWADEIHKLLGEEASSGCRNGWHEACERRGQTAIFVTDVARAWRLAEDLFEDNPSRAISLQCRYALIVSTLNSLSADLPPSLLVALLQKHLWVPQQGLAYALRSSNPDTKAILLTEISDYLPQNLKEKALEKALVTARAIPPGSARADALRGLADKLPSVLPEALAAARAIPPGIARAKALIALADKLPSMLPEALAAVRAIQNEQYRADALSALADKLPPDLLPEALAVVKAFPSGITRVEALKILAPKLPADLLLKALTIAWAFRGWNSEYCLALALSAVVDFLPEKLKAEVLEEALNAARALESKEFRDNVYRASALTAVVDKLPEKLKAEVLEEALDAARAVEEDWCRAIALSNLADKLPEKLEAGVLQEALDAVSARGEEEDWSNTIALSVLVPKLPPDLLPQALAIASAIQNEQYRADALRVLADKLSPELLPELLATARTIQNKDDRSDVLRVLADKLPPELLLEALAIARAIHDEDFRASALGTLADKLPELLPEALASVRAIPPGIARASALGTLADKLPELLPETLTSIGAIEDEQDRAIALIALADKLSPESLPEAFAAASAIRDEDFRVSALSSLADKLPPELLPEANASARTIENEQDRAIALSVLMDKLPELLPETLATTSTIQNERDRANVLISLADMLLPELLPEAFTATRTIEDESERAIALSILVDMLLPELLTQALATAEAVQDECFRADVLRILANKLPPELLPQALAATNAIEDERDRADVLSTLASKLPPELLPQALTIASAIQSEQGRRVQALITLASKQSKMQTGELFPFLQKTLHSLSFQTRRDFLHDIPALASVICALGDRAAVAEVARAIQDVGRWWP